MFLPDLSAATLFCEDVRLEKSEQISLIGIFNDNVNLPEIPSILGKLSIFTRVNISVGFVPAQIDMFLKLPNGQEIIVGNISSSFVKSAIDEALGVGIDVARVTIQSTASPFAVEFSGWMTAVLRTGSREFTTGAINFGIVQS